MTRVTTSTADGVIRIEGADYALELAADEASLSKAPVAHLRDADGAQWSELSLLASVAPYGGSDETHGVHAPVVTHGTDVDGREFVEVSLTADSTAWTSRTLTLRCRAEGIEASVVVTGEGQLGDVTLLGGEFVSSTGACGTFRSGISFRSVFVPNPTEPVQFVRSSHSPSQLGIVGDASPGRLNAVFSPPPLVWALGRDKAGDGADAALAAAHGDGSALDTAWLGIGLVDAVEALTFTTARYEPLDSGFLLRLAYEGHTQVQGRWSSPSVLISPASGPWQALDDYRAALAHRGLARTTDAAAAWWSEPIFCGWGAQCARAAATGGFAPDLARQDVYDEVLARLEVAGVVPGTVVIDDKWQAAYGTCEVDRERWPDLKAWIARQHAAGRKVLLWFRAWDPEGLPADECIVTPDGRPVAADPFNDAYTARLGVMMQRLLGVDGLDADGLKVDFTQRAPVGASLIGREGGWGVAGLHRMLQLIYRAAHAAKPDALVVTHAVHPSFGDVGDMVRLNDVLERDPRGAKVDVALQARLRAAIAERSQPATLIDTDQWPMPDREQWLAYSRAQVELGVPALYYAESIDGSGERIGDDDLREIAGLWDEYRSSHAR